MRPLVLVAITVGSMAASVAAGDPDKPKDDSEDLRGIWATVMRSVGGVIVPDDPTTGPLLTAFDRGVYLQRHGEQIVEEGRFTIDTSHTPATIDLQIKKGPEAGKRQLGIFLVEGDELKLCLAGPGVRKRPNDFHPKAGSTSLVVVCRRYRP